ncbi:hypothetical protein PENTCL1PPCAC_7524, partial [Pristionchus entomophagus]
ATIIALSSQMRDFVLLLSIIFFARSEFKEWRREGGIDKDLRPWASTGIINCTFAGFECNDSSIFIPLA